jgi:hypothetical protein
VTLDWELKLTESEFPTEADGVAYYEGIERVLLKHFCDLENLPIEDMTLRYMTTLSEAFPMVWSVRKTKSQLRKMKRHFNEIKRIHSELPFALGEFFDENAANLMGVNRDDDFHQLSLRGGERVDESNYPTLSEAFTEGLYDSEFLELQVTFDQIIERAMILAEHGVPRGKKGLSAWEIVQGCATICVQFPGAILVPNAMNESGPFFRFLVDMFELHDEGSDPVAAFKGWKKHVVSSARK